MTCVTRWWALNPTCSFSAVRDWRTVGEDSASAQFSPVGRSSNLGHGCLGVVLEPASILPESRQDDEARERAAKKISKTRELIGFVRVGDKLISK